QAPAAVAVERHRIVGDLLPEIALDHIDPLREQLFVRVAPPRVRGRMREIEDAAFGKRRQHAAERARRGRGVPAQNAGSAVRIREQELARGELLEERRVNRYV